jgi:hypothetical protein
VVAERLCAADFLLPFNLKGDQGLSDDAFEEPARKPPIGVAVDEFKVGFNDLEFN